MSVMIRSTTGPELQFHGFVIQCTLPLDGDFSRPACLLPQFTPSDRQAIASSRKRYRKSLIAVTSPPYRTQSRSFELKICSTAVTDIATPEPLGTILRRLAQSRLYQSPHARTSPKIVADASPVLPKAANPSPPTSSLFREHLAISRPLPCPNIFVPRTV